MHKLVDFLNIHGNQLTILNIGKIKINSDQFKDLIELTPNINYLSISNNRELTDDALAHLKGMRLKLIVLTGCKRLTDKVFDYLKDIQVEEITLDDLKRKFPFLLRRFLYLFDSKRIAIFF